VKNASKVDTIGSVELVDFPELYLQDIPAKIDTGADNSTIWATDINMENGVLQYVLFGPGNGHYKGDIIQTKNFRTTSIKNSSGQTEFRYKIIFLVRIGNRKIRAWFTLSDRSGMTYPVLIGKKLLRNKYVVDVSKHKIHGGIKSTRNVLVLSSNPTDLDNFFSHVAKEMDTKTKIVVRSYEDLAFNISDSRVSIVDVKTNRDLSKFDLVYFKSHRRYSPVAMAVAVYLQFKNVKFFDKELLTHVSYDKLSEYTRLALYGLPVPKSICGSKDYLLKNIDYIGDKLGWPLVCKEISEDRGRKNYLIQDATELRKVLQNAVPSEIYVVQKYIDNDGYIRVFVFGRQAALAVKRNPVFHTNPGKQHLNNPVGSANAKIIPEIDIDPVAHNLAIRSSEIMNRQIAGVDLIQDRRSKKWLLLEINNAPQLKSGSFADKKQAALAKFINFELNR